MWGKEVSKMTAKELAKKLNGNEYDKEISIELEQEARRNELVVVFGWSDDNMEFCGAVCDEIPCYSGGIAYIGDGGKLLKNECDNDECPYFELEKQTSLRIEAIWDQEGYSWIYKTDIPHETFDIYEDGEKYCRGIVFSLEDL
jgi:hypothetical protein